MKRITALLLSLLLLAGLCGCGTKKTADLPSLYDSLAPSLPEMLVLEGETRLNLTGIAAEDCSQVVVAICGSGLRADEVWLVEARDAAALGRIKALAEGRLAAKRAETEDYLPDQFQVVQQAQTLTEGLVFALLVSPDAAALRDAVRAALR